MTAITETLVDWHDAHSLWVQNYRGANRLSAAASDIVFNHDWSACRDDDGNWFVERMHEEAKHLAYCISMVGEPCDHLDVLSDLFGRM